jgi:hypothetical protein
LLDQVATIRLNTPELFYLAAGPTDHEPVNIRGLAQPKVDAFTRLRHKSVAGTQSLDKCRMRITPPRDNHLDPCSNRVAVCRRSIALQTNGQMIVFDRHIIAQETHLRPAAVCDPQIQISILVPIDPRHSSTVVCIIQTTGR